MATPIGITFMPTDEASAQGQRRGSLEGLTEQVFKILSLRMPRVVGARAISPLMGGQGGPGAGAMGAAGAGGYNPNAAVFEALLRTMGQGGPGPAGGPSGGIPAPNIVPGQLAPEPSPPPMSPRNPMSTTPRRRTFDV